MLETLASRELGCDCKRQAAVPWVAAAGVEVEPQPPAGAVMDAQQQLDLVMRHQSMATVCESEVQARLSLPPSLSLCSIVPRWQDSTFSFLVLIGVLVAARALLAVVWWLWLMQDALGSSESDPARPARPRGKRSRAAEVHNLSEKVGAGCVAGPCLSLLAPFRHWTVR